jgi:hypothetical protein
MTTPLKTKQQGLALILFLITALTVAGGSFFITAQRIKNSSIQTDTTTYKALAAAKQTLVAYSIGYAPDDVTQSEELGRLPYPDRSSDPGGLDGMSDCLSYGTTPGPINNLSLLIGRLPWLGTEPPCPGPNSPINFDLRDSAGERLWYAVAPHMVPNLDNALFSPDILDPDAPNQWITLYDENGLVSDRIAFIVISAGTAHTGQNRNSNTISDYLDSYTVPGVGNINNYDTDLTFVKAAKSDNFNDKLIYVTIDELMPLIQKRILLNIRNLLTTYQTTHGFYPHPAPLGLPSYNCDTTISPSGGFIATFNTGTNACTYTPATITLNPNLVPWQPYIIYEPRMDCMEGNNPNCNNQAGGLTLDGVDNKDMILISSGFHTLPSTANRADYLDEAINVADDQIFVTPANQQLIFQ